METQTLDSTFYWRGRSLITSGDGHHPGASSAQILWPSLNLFFHLNLKKSNEKFLKKFSQYFCLDPVSSLCLSFWTPKFGALWVTVFHSFRFPKREDYHSVNSIHMKIILYILRWYFESEMPFEIKFFWWNPFGNLGTMKDRQGEKYRFDNVKLQKWKIIRPCPLRIS